MIKIVAAAALAIQLVLSAVPLQALAAESGAPYEINAILSLTGTAAFLGSHYARTLHVLETTVNEDGGIGGRPIKFVIQDDTSNPQTAVQLAGVLIQKNVPVIIGPGFTSSCAAVLPLVDKTGPVMYCTSPVVQPSPGSFMFSAGPSTIDSFVATLRALRAHGWKRIALITTTDASGQDAERAIDALLKTPEGEGFDVVDTEHFNGTDVTVAAQIARIKAASPQAIFTFAVGTSFGTLLRGINDAGLTLPIFGSGGNLNYAQLESYSAFMPKELYLEAARGSIPDPAASAGVKAAQVKFFNAFKDAGLHVEYLDTVIWDPAMLVVDALRKFGLAASARQVRTFIADAHGWAGLVGQYDFRAIPQRGIGPNGVAIYSWNPQKKAYTAITIPKGR